MKNSEISVMSFNTGMLPKFNLPKWKKYYEKTRGRKPNNTFLQQEDVEMIGRIVTENPHMIYALQEVWTPELLEGVREHLGDEYVAFFPYDARRGLLNKKFTTGIVHKSLAEDTGFIYSTVDGYDRIPSLRVSTPNFDVYGVHLRAAFTGPAKVRELGGVIEDANKRNDGRPQLIVGDFNLFEAGDGSNVVANKLHELAPYIPQTLINGTLQLVAWDSIIKKQVSSFEDLGALEKNIRGEAETTTFQGMMMRPTRAYLRNAPSRNIEYKVLDDVFEAEKREIFQDHFPVSVTIPI